MTQAFEAHRINLGLVKAPFSLSRFLWVNRGWWLSGVAVAFGAELLFWSRIVFAIVVAGALLLMFTLGMCKAAAKPEPKPTIEDLCDHKQFDSAYGVAPLAKGYISIPCRCGRYGRTVRTK